MNDDLILRAARLATTVHNGQNRKWGHSADPYIFHPMRVAGLVSLNTFATEEIVAAAWLHDTLEDTTLTETQLIAHGFGGPVTFFVTQMTNASKVDPAMKNKPRAERKAADRAKIAAAPWEVRFIKLADRLDNVMEMRNDSQTPADFVKLYTGESRLLLEVLKGIDSVLEARLAALVN